MTERQTSVKTHQWRLMFLRAAIGLFAVVLVGRLFTLQVKSYDYYSSLAANQHQFLSVLTAERGQILIQSGSRNVEDKPEQSFYPVAVNKKAENLIISPFDIKDQEATIETLSQITKKTQGELRDFFKDKNKRYVVVKKDLSEEEIKAVTEALEQRKLTKGVWLETETKRHYPEGDFLSQVVGFLGYTEGADEKTGLYGLEKSFNEILSGRPGQIEAATDPGGTLIAGSQRKLIPAKPGSNIVLTINHTIQAEVERVLKDAVSKFGADSGQVIVADPKSGEVLALASAPSFNPNEYNKVKDIQVFNNPAVQLRYEPGSIIKPLTMAAALQVGAVKPSDTYDDKGEVVYADHVIKNSDEKAHGVQTMTQVLEKSLNTGMVYVQNKIGKDTLQKFFQDFGLNSKTGITLPGEIAGDLRNLEDKRSDINYATASFGQGISATPIEIVQAYTALANHGQMTKLHLVSEIDHPDGSKEVVKTEKGKQVLSNTTAAQIGSMLVEVVEKGHGTRAQVPGFWIAGKTGTAQVPLPSGRGYDPNKTIGSFIGFGPVEDPKFVMLVKIDNPKGVAFAESTAAPTFGTIAKFILDYFQVAPSRATE